MAGPSSTPCPLVGRAAMLGPFVILFTGWAADSAQRRPGGADQHRPVLEPQAQSPLPSNGVAAERRSRMCPVACVRKVSAHCTHCKLNGSSRSAPRHPPGCCCSSRRPAVACSGFSRARSRFGSRFGSSSSSLQQQPAGASPPCWCTRRRCRAGWGCCHPRGSLG